MRVQNPAMAGSALVLESGKEVSFDDEGIGEVSDKDGQFLVATPGWEVVGKKGVKAPDAAPKAAAKPPPHPEPEEAEEPTEDDDDEDEVELEAGPDLDAMTKPQLIQTATDWGIEVDPRSSKAEIYKRLNEEIYGG